ncbi:MarR family winged helix-turn-helix transcriptional regulator [Microbacterium marinilacus]|uniref:MarR family transcriptional regulator n=1 Tax=Microbacterium marinilacus TaxID=415209 RepID=A0ABP7BED1_9MICO|nr:MarR family transcriptional regulator [Microbacterium marinilacus]MBY0688887.1 MarR family transcriptional regulator [Microbacterium marinilacus]
MTRKPALTAEEEDAWAQLFVIAQCLPAVVDQQLRSDAGLGHYEHAVLHALYRAEGSTLAMAELSTLTAGSFSRLSHSVTRLEDRELVSRDRRGANRYVSLTRAGRMAFLDAASGHMDQIRRTVLDLIDPADVATLGDLLRPIAAGLRDRLPRG